MHLSRGIGSLGQREQLNRRNQILASYQNWNYILRNSLIRNLLCFYRYCLQSYWETTETVLEDEIAAHHHLSVFHTDMIVEIETLVG